MERDLKTLRRSRLMNYSEFRTMTTSLERYYKDVKLAMMLKHKENKELDMRPYLFDEGDSYDKPFYNTLLKMLYEVTTSIYYDKQYEDLKKIYNWYKANKKLITSPPSVPIPEPRVQTPDTAYNKKTPDLPEDDSASVDIDDEEAQEKFKKVPKLHLRPKTAPPIENKGGVRYVTWNEAQAKKGCKRPSSGRVVYHSREQYAREQIAKSLKISQIGHNGEKTPSDRYHLHPSVYGGRPSTAPPNNMQARLKDGEHTRSYVFKPYSSTPAPVSSPVQSPMTSPRDSPVPFRAKSPQLSAHFKPKRHKDPPVKLNVRLPKENREVSGKDDQSSVNDSTSDKDSSLGDDKENDEKLPTSVLPSTNATPSELKQILQNQIHEEKLLEEQHGLLQKKLLHEYDRYARDCAMLDKELKMNVEMMEGQVALNVNGNKPSPVMTYDRPSSDVVIPSYNRVFSKDGSTNHSRSRSAEPPVVSPIQSGYSPARHVRHTTVPSYRPDDFNVNMVLDMVAPIGLQMEHDRERQNGYVAPGMKQPSSTISQPPPRLNSRLTDPTPLWETSSVSSSGQESARSSVQTPLELKSKQPELTSERSERDYKVHFQQDKTPDTSKSFKISGPVSPDTIRYQWTDDGFGSMTYLKKLKSPVSPRTPRKKETPRAPHVTMPTGSRSLDKRTLASLMLVKQLGETDRRESNRMGVVMSEKSAPATIPSATTATSTISTAATPTTATPSAISSTATVATPSGPVEYKYHVEYMSICQPVGPRLGETDRPSTVAWYLQGDHGLYRDPKMHNESDEIRIKREVRIAKDRSLMIEGKHIGGGEQTEKEEEKTPQKDESKDVSKTSPSTKQETYNTTIASEPPKQVKRAVRATSPLPRRPPSAPHDGHRHISIPTGKGFGTASRPCSARSDRSDKKFEFSVKQFNHFCWPDDAVLTDDVIRQREVWAAVNIQRIFRGFMARQYYRTLHEAEKDRQRRAALTLQSHLRGFLTRKKLEVKMMNYTPTTRTKEWARQYKEDLKMRESARAQKKNIVLIKLNKEAEKQDENIKQVKAHQNIYDIYHPAREGPTKAQMKAAAITIQRYLRGWFVRRMYQKVKTKALKRTLSFNKFIKGYQSLIYRIQKRYGVENPNTELQFNELMEYVERLNKYEIAFEKFAVDGLLSYNDIKEYFKSVGHMPSQKEIDEAIEIVTKSSGKGKSLTKAEAVEILFQIYVPKGTGMKLSDVRKSTWLNPLNDGQDIMQLLSKKDLEETNLAKCLALVANAGQENEEIQDLLRPASSKKTEKKSEKKGGKDRRVTLAQYPLRPSSSSSTRSRSKSPKPKR